MNIEDIRQKYQCDASQTFAQWKEWVRKNKPSQAQAHIVKAVAPNGSKYERVIGGYTDAQNTAFDLVSHGYKDVKLYHSVNAGPLKLLRNFSAPLHGAKFKDSADLMDAEDKKNDITRAYPYQDILNRFMTLTFGRPRKTQAMPEEKSEVKRAYDLFKKNAGNSKFANEWLPKYKRFFKKFGIILDSAEDSLVQRIADKYAMDAMPTQKKDQPAKVVKISIDPFPAGGFAGNVYYTKNGETDLYTPWQILANGKWAFPFGRMSTRLTPSDKKSIEQKIKKLVAQKGIKVKDSADLMDAAMGIKISGNEKGTERLTMEKVFKEWVSPAAAWQKVKKGNTIMIRFNGNGPNKKLKGKDVLKIEYFNQNVVAMTPRSGGTQLVGFPRINVMVGKLASEGLRSYPEFENQLLKKDSADDFASDAMDRIRAKYCLDVAGAGVVNPNFKFSTNVERRLATTRRGKAMTLPQYGKPSKVTVKKDGNSFSVIGKDGQKLNKSPFKSYEEAEKWARGNGFMVERK